MPLEFRKLKELTRPADVGEVRLPRCLRAAVLAPHPDDLDAMGVTLRFLMENGCPVRAGVAKTGSGVEGSFLPGGSLRDKARLREREQRASAAFLGLAEENLEFLDLERDETDQAKESRANQGLIGAFLAASGAGLVLLPHGNDTNSAHRAVAAMLERYASEAHAPRPLTVLFCRDPKTTAMRAGLFMPFDRESAEWKARLLRFHDSQQQRNLASRGRGFDERILETNRAAARELGLSAEYAEVFEVRVYG